MKLSGVFPALTTPFDNKGDVAADRLAENVRRYNDTGIAGYVVIGSTGESVLLSNRETEVVLATVRDAAAPGKMLIAGTGTDSTAETQARTKRAAEIGYHAALVKTPYYYKPVMTAEVLYEHFVRVADASPIPVLLYSVPVFTGITLEAPLVARLAAHSNIIGIKDSSGSVQRVAEIVSATPAEFQTLTGSGTTFYPSLAVGACGGVLAIADVLPEMCVEVFNATRGGQFERAGELQMPLMAATSVIVSRLGIPGVKYGMDTTGYYGGAARRPLPQLSPAEKSEVDAVLRGIGSVKPAAISAK